MSNAPSKPVSFSRPKVGYFSNRPRTCYEFVGVDNKLYKMYGTYTKIENTTRCYLLFYCTSYRLNMFRALLRPSSGARDYNVD